MSTAADSSFRNQRIAIRLASGPNPPWTNKYFVCACGAEYQLGCSDECKTVDLTAAALWIETQPCWSCGKVNVIQVPSESEPEGNPS